MVLPICISMTIGENTNTLMEQCQFQQYYWWKHKLKNKKMCLYLKQGRCGCFSSNNVGGKGEGGLSIGQQSSRTPDDWLYGLVIKNDISSQG